MVSVIVLPQNFRRVCCFAVMKILVSSLKFGAKPYTKPNYLKKNLRLFGLCPGYLNHPSKKINYTSEQMRLKRYYTERLEICPYTPQ